MRGLNIMRHRLIRYLPIVLAVLFVVDAIAQPLAVVGDKAVYVYWGPGSAAAYRIERSESKGKYITIAQVAAVTDPQQAQLILTTAPDVFSHSLTVGPEFPSRISEHPDLDKALALASTGYARIRAQGYVDTEVKRERQYSYRVIALLTGGAESVLGEVDVDTAAPTVPVPSQISVGIVDGQPRIGFAAMPLLRYHIERADGANDKFQRITFVALVTGSNGETLQYDDKTAAADGREYRYRVLPQTVFDQVGAASATSAVRMPDRTPPDAPILALPDNRAGAVGLSWQGKGEPDLSGFHIYRREVLKGKEGDKQLRLADEKRLTTSALVASVLQFEDRELVPGHVYQYSVSALDRSGNESAQSPPVLARPRDTQPPARPQGLAARVLDDGRVMLSWKPNTDADLYTYRLYLAADDGKPRFQNEVDIRNLKPKAMVTQEVKLDVNSEATYRYTIAAVDASENESPMSEAVSVRLPDHVPPAAPIIRTIAAESGALVLSWVPSISNDVAGYHIWRGEAPTALVRLSSKPLSADVFDYRDGTASPGGIHYYAVSALDRAGNESQRSEPRSATTFTQRETLAPDKLRIDTGVRPVRLLWQAQDAITGYVVYTGSSQVGDYHQYGELVTTASVALPPATDEAQWYRVQAVYADGAVSPLSIPIAQSGRNEGR